MKSEHQMKRLADLLRPGRAGGMVIPLLVALALSSAGEPIADIRKAAQTTLENADTDVTFKKQELAKKYAVALEALEKKLTSAGDLDGVVHTREERAEVLKSGNTTAYADKTLVELRDKYRKSIDGIDTGITSAKAKAVEQIRKSLREQEAVLTKAGKVDEALALRKQGEQLLLEFGGGAEVGFQEDPRIAQKTVLKGLEPVTLPAEKPPVKDTPFANKDRWLEGLTIPAAKQKIRQGIIIGDRAKKSWPVVIVTPGSHWDGGDSGYVEVSAGNFVTEKSRYQDVRFFTDLSCHVYFTRCLLEKCRFDKGGVWYGSEQAGKFYFKDCVVRGGSFSAKSINVVDHGFRAENTVFEDVEMPHMLFRKKQPADYLNHKWLRFVNCRFTGCTIPVSFLYLTRDCIFEKCTFVDSPPPAKPDEEVVNKPFEIVVYTTACKSKDLTLPDKFKLVDRPASSLQGVVIPTAAELMKLIGP
jgi:hypothetical protein